MVVFPYTRPPASVVKSMPTEWFLCKSETSWMRNEVFYEHIINGVNKRIETNEIPKPILLFIDGHKSHFTWHLSKWDYIISPSTKLQPHCANCGDKRI